MSKQKIIPKTKFEWEIVKLVRNKRDVKDISQAKIADLLGVTRGYIGQIETKSYGSMYKYDQLNKIAMFLECSPRDFLPEFAIEYHD